MKKLRFAYLSADDPKDKKVWSGTHYNIYKCLLSIGEVEILGPYQPKARLFIARVINQFCLLILKKRFDYRHSCLISKGFGKYFNTKLRGKTFDLIIAPAASCELAHLETKIPVIYITDGTFAGCLNYHKTLTDLTANSVYEGNFVEQKAINKSDRVIVPSEWAANSVIADYNYDKNKLINIPYGANFEKLPGANDLNFEVPKIWKLLFMGVFWENKGGDIAFNCFKILQEKGFSVEFTVLGCAPPENIKHAKMQVIPFIDKNSKEGSERLFNILSEQHVLILPTRFDCSPIVINEASAFGLPSIVAKTGGVEGHLKDGINGFLVDYKDNGTGYAERIEQLITDPEKYISLKKSTRELYDEKLNWNSWKREFLKAVEALI